MAQRVAWGIAILAVVIGGFLWLRQREDRRERAREQPAITGHARVTEGPAGSPARRPTEHVRRLASPAERQALADRIAAAHAVRVARAGSHGPSLPEDDPGHDLERASPRLKQALGEAIPLLAECYKTGAMTEKRPAVQMTLVGDPEVGTLIDADQLKDPNGQPLDPELESCLRTTLSSLELPPLGNTEPLHLQYSFRFDESGG